MFPHGTSNINAKQWHHSIKCWPFYFVYPFYQAQLKAMFFPGGLTWSNHRLQRSRMYIVAQENDYAHFRLHTRKDTYYLEAPSRTITSYQTQTHH